jgi:hypothetical protein
MPNNTIQKHQFFQHIVINYISVLHIPQISLQPNCEKIQPLLRQAENDYKLLLLAAAAFGAFGIILIILAFVLWK